MDSTMTDKKFIFTEDRQAAQRLRDAGFTEIPTATAFLFINDGPKRMAFENINLEKLVFTNTVCL